MSGFITQARGVYARVAILADFGITYSAPQTPVGFGRSAWRSQEVATDCLCE